MPMMMNEPMWSNQLEGTIMQVPFDKRLHLQKIFVLLKSEMIWIMPPVQAEIFFNGLNILFSWFFNYKKNEN